MSEENTNEEEEIMPDQKMALSHLNSIDDNDLLSDFDRWEDYSNNNMPDGLMDSSAYVDAVCKIIDVVVASGDLESSKNRSNLLLLLAKHGASFDGVVALSYVMTILLSNLDDIQPGALDSFRAYMDEEVKRSLEEHRNVPYWNAD